MIKYLHICTGLIIACLLQYQIAAAQVSVVIGAVDPLKKVLKTDTDFSNATPVADVARGEDATIQFVARSPQNIQNLKATITGIKNGAAQLKGGQVRYVGYVKVKALAKTPAKDRLQPNDMSYPDPLLEDAPRDVPANTSQPVWITVPIPVNAVPGTYTGQLTLEGRTSSGAFRQTKNFQIRVYSVQVKNTSLWVSLWPSIENTRIGGMARKLSFMNSGKDVTPYADNYWAYVKTMADMMHDYHQNVVFISPLHMIDYTFTNGKFGFDFSKFDKMVEIFRNAGVIGRIEGGPVAGRNGGWTANFVLLYYVQIGNKIVSRSGDLRNKDVINFYQQYIPALVAHLKEKNWYNIYYQHIGDEPMPDNAKSWIDLANFIKKLAPDMKTIEAIQTPQVGDELNILVPQLDLFASKYSNYQDYMDKGKEVWFYTSWMPQGEYANRFIELPLIKTRVLHWINYKYKLKGYLHWAYNYWGDNPFGETTKTLSGNTTLPGGDSWIVYPKNGGLLSSLRLEAMRDGIIDYELLKMLAARSPKLSTSITNSIVQSFNAYETDISRFRKARLQLLQALSK